jgi:hypothetical protein
MRSSCAGGARLGGLLTHEKAGLRMCVKNTLRLPRGLRRPPIRPPVFFGPASAIQSSPVQSFYPNALGARSVTGIIDYGSFSLQSPLLETWSIEI